MAAAIKALNAKIRSNKYSDYFCSTRTFYLFGCRIAIRQDTSAFAPWSAKKRQNAAS
jgi:hypothetical protein